MDKGSMSLVGLRDIVTAPLLTDNEAGATYGAIKKYAPAKTASITPASSNSNEYADDGVIDVISSNGPIALSLGTAGVDEEVRAEILGADYEDGITKYHKDRQSPFVAVGFKSPKANGHFIYIWLLKGKFSNPSREFATKEDTATPQSNTIEGSFIDRRFDGMQMITLDTQTASEEDAKDFFKSVPGAPVSDNTPEV